MGGRLSHLGLRGLRLLRLCSGGGADLKGSCYGRWSSVCALVYEAYMKG